MPTKEAIDKVQQKAKKYLPDVADAYAYDVSSGELIFKATALTDSSVEITTTENKQRAGRGNAVQYITHTDKDVTVTLTSIEFMLEYFAAQIGTTIRVGSYQVTSGEVQLQAAEGIITIPVAPLNNQVAVDINGQTINVAVSEAEGIYTADLTGYGVTDECITTVYLYEATAAGVTIDAASEPMIVKLALDTPIYNNTVGEIGALQYIFDRFQFNGNATNSLTAGNSGTFELSGSPIASKSAQCDGRSVYGYIVELSKNAEELYAVYAIAASPNDLELAPLEKATLEVYGVRGAESIIDRIKLDNSLCTFTSDHTEYATVTENGGEVSGVAEGDAVITVKYDDLEATVNVSVLAG